jgi:hypothetical protein
LCKLAPRNELSSSILNFSPVLATHTTEELELAKPELDLERLGAGND